MSKRLREKALKNAGKYTGGYKPKWIDRLRSQNKKLADEIEQLVRTWKTDQELQRAYPTKTRLAKFIADLPGVDASFDVIRKQEVFKG